MDENIQQTPSPQQTPQVTPPMPEPPKTFGWLKWVFIVLIVALISSGTTYFVMNQSQKSQQPPQVTQTTPTLAPDPTANWKTYTNTQYGVEFMYPENWKLKVTKSLAEDHPDQERNFIQVNVDNGVYWPPSVLESMEPPPGFAGLVFQVGKLRDSKQDFREFTESDLSGGLGGSLWGPIDKSTVGNYQALSANNGIDLRYYIEQDESHYTTIGLTIKSASAGDKQIVEKILKSIKLSSRQS